MVKCEDDDDGAGNAGPNKSRNSDGGRSNNNDLGVDYFREDDESAAAGKIPAIPALPHLSPLLAPLQPMVPPTFYATTPGAAMKETGNAQELAPSIRRGLIDVTPEETGEMAGSEGNLDAGKARIGRHFSF